MLTYSKLSKKPKIFKGTTGVTVEQYEKIINKLRPYWEKSEKKRLSHPDRKRKIGAGPKYHLKTLEDKALPLFIYYRIYVTMDIIGLLFNLDKSSISRIIERIERVMKKIDLLPGEKPQKKIKRVNKINNMKDFLEEYPEMSEMIVDVTEHTIERPKRQQKKYYSGKKNTIR